MNVSDGQRIMVRAFMFSGIGVKPESGDFDVESSFDPQSDVERVYPHSLMLPAAGPVGSRAS